MQFSLPLGSLICVPTVIKLQDIELVPGRGLTPLLVVPDGRRAESYTTPAEYWQAT